MPSQILSAQIFDEWTPATDTAVLTLGEQEPNSQVTNCGILANGAEWGLKMPHNVGSTISRTALIGGTDRALDIVRGNGLRFVDCAFSNGHDRSATKSKWAFTKACDIGIKGGAYDIEFSGCTFSDILLGDHCIYDNPKIGPKTRGITLRDCKHPEGKPIILRILNAEMPTLVNTEAVALVYYRTVVLTYFWIAGKWIDKRTAPV